MQSYISENFPNHVYLDFDDFKFDDDKYYADLTHLNYEGANIFSHSINDSIKYIFNKINQ